MKLKVFFTILFFMLFSISILSQNEKKDDVYSEENNIELSDYYSYIQASINDANKKLTKNKWKITSAVLDLNGTTKRTTKGGFKFLIFDFSKSKEVINTTNIVLTASAPIVQSSGLKNANIIGQVQDIVNYLVENCTSIEGEYRKKAIDLYPKSLNLTIINGVTKNKNGKLEFKIFNDFLDISGGKTKGTSFLQKVTFTAERVTPEKFKKKEKKDE